jgi:hypothetical protein
MTQFNFVSYGTIVTKDEKEAKAFLEKKITEHDDGHSFVSDTPKVIIETPGWNVCDFCKRVYYSEEEFVAHCKAEEEAFAALQAEEDENKK